MTWHTTSALLPIHDWLGFSISLLFLALAHFGDALGDGGGQGWNVMALLVGFDDGMGQD